jgi:hypothetical protein
MSSLNIHSVQTSNATAIQPLLASMKTNNDKLPSNAFPSNTLGTVQQNADKEAIADVTLYNAHGILVKTNPNSLLALI